MTNETLKPCPFCGGEAGFSQCTASGYYWVKCLSCGATAASSAYQEKSVAIAAWNQRADGWQDEYRKAKRNLSIYQEWLVAKSTEEEQAVIRQRLTNDELSIIPLEHASALIKLRVFNALVTLFHALPTPPKEES